MREIRLTTKPMNTKAILLILLGLMASISGCNKDKEEEIPTTPKIKTITFYQNEQQKSQQSFEYDLSGKLIKRSYSNGDWLSYSYNQSAVIENHYISQIQKALPDTLLLNYEGLAISEDHGTSTMEYDADGYLIKKNNLTAERYTFLYEIKNGNRVKGSMIANNDYMTLRVMQTNTFLPNSTNTTGNENMGIVFLGKQDKQLVSTIEYSQGLPLNLEYEYDSSNRVSKCKLSDGTSRVYTYY